MKKLNLWFSCTVLFLIFLSSCIMTESSDLPVYPPPTPPIVQAYPYPALLETPIFPSLFSSTPHYLSTPTPYILRNLPFVSPCVLVAKEYIAEVYDVSPDRVHIEGNHQVYWIDLPHIHRRVCTVNAMIIGHPPTTLIPVSVDNTGQIVNLRELQSLENEAVFARCGKLDEVLCASLPFMWADRMAEVEIWLTDPEKAKEVCDYLTSGGFEFSYDYNNWVVVYATLPKAQILALVERIEVRDIRLQPKIGPRDQSYRGGFRSLL